MRTFSRVHFHIADDKINTDNSGSPLNDQNEKPRIRHSTAVLQEQDLDGIQRVHG